MCRDTAADSKATTLRGVEQRWRKWFSKPAQDLGAWSFPLSKDSKGIRRVRDTVAFRFRKEEGDVMDVKSKSKHACWWN